MTCRTRDLEMADQIVQRTLDIIDYLQPRHWFIENPKTGLLKGRPFMKEYAFVDVDYCQFSSWGYQKPTRIWGPMYLKNLKSRVCDQKTCTNLVVRSSGHWGHRRVLGATPQDGAPRVPLEDQYRIPEGLIYYLMGWARLDQDWIKSPVDPAGKNLPKNSAASVTTLNPVAPSFPPPQREEWGKLIGLAEDCTLCKQGDCGYVKPQTKDTQINTTTWVSARHQNARRQQCRRICTMMSELPIQEDLTPVTPRRGPRTAMAKEKRKKKANLHNPKSKSPRHPPQPPFIDGNQTVVETPDDGRRPRNGRTTPSFHRTPHPSLNSVPLPRNQ